MRNLLLNALGEAERAMLLDGAHVVPVQAGDVLVRPGQRIDHAWFPLSGIYSMVADATGRELEVGLIGREGFVGASLLPGADWLPHKVFVQMPGEAVRVGGAVFERCVAESPALLRILLRFAQAMWAQASYTAVSNARDSIGQRLARRLLMCRDRGDSDEIALTHTSLASTLGVQRPGVTLALHELEGAGMIRAHRARITIRDRQTLERLASCYGPAEAEYRKLMGVAVRQAVSAGPLDADAA